MVSWPFSRQCNYSEFALNILSVGNFHLHSKTEIGRYKFGIHPGSCLHALCNRISSVSPRPQTRDIEAAAIICDCVFVCGLVFAKIDWRNERHLSAGDGCTIFVYDRTPHRSTRSAHFKYERPSGIAVDFERPTQNIFGPQPCRCEMKSGSTAQDHGQKITAACSIRNDKGPVVLH